MNTADTMERLARMDSRIVLDTLTAIQSAPTLEAAFQAQFVSEDVPEHPGLVTLLLENQFVRQADDITRARIIPSRFSRPEDDSDFAGITDE